MDQKKTGQFLKTLRKEKQITQEALAEILHVSNRTVSRWETGSNMRISVCWWNWRNFIRSA